MNYPYYLGSPRICRWTRFGGIVKSSGKETISLSKSPTIKSLREVSLCRCHIARRNLSCLQPNIVSDSRFGGKPPSGKVSIHGQSDTVRCCRVVRSCIRLGRDLRFSHSNINSALRLWMGNPLSGKYSKEEH
uniref:Uncharacterized protein n=1 Tax=Gossypium raimondii TaxID=29730 RepID=A0A0D2R696_GOSRA|nr:hypothetical protein B456_004G169800 [Gossypium raimondii]